MNTPRSATITIVVPAYNAGHYIDQCCDSVLAQTSENWACIIVDDGSTDGSIERISNVTDPRISVIRQANRGVSNARNRGLAAADSPYVMFLDADDRLHPSALERLSDALKTDKAPIAAFGTFVKILEDGSIAPHQKPLDRHVYPSGNVLRHMLRENFLANGGHVLVRTEAARAIGGFNERLGLSEDWEFWCRLACIGAFLFVGRQPEVFYLRLRRESSSARALDWTAHQASIQAVLSNREIRRHFKARDWERLSRRVVASHMWEAGRQNFTHRKFGRANRLMARSLRLHFTRKRSLLLLIAQVSRCLNLSLISRLRFVDHDYPD